MLGKQKLKKKEVVIHTGHDVIWLATMMCEAKDIAVNDRNIIRMARQIVIDIKPARATAIVYLKPGQFIT